MVSKKSVPKSVLQAFTDNTEIKHLVLLWIIAISKVNIANVNSPQWLGAGSEKISTKNCKRKHTGRNVTKTCSLVVFFFWGHLTLPACKSIEGGRKRSSWKKAINWYGFQSAPYRSRPIHFLSLEGTTNEKKECQKDCIKIWLVEKEKVLLFGETNDYLLQFIGPFLQNLSIKKNLLICVTL